jgi:hypothetical protein
MKIRHAFTAICLAALAGCASTHAGSGGTSEMDRNMTKMQDEMSRIHSTSDPQERKRLMNEHMKTMHERMGMTQKMMEQDKTPETQPKETHPH